MKIVATYSIKGGVGKTTAAANLAFEAARSGWRVLLWDLDPQGAATFLLRVDPDIKGGASRIVGPKGTLADHLQSTNFPALNIVPADLSFRNLDLRLDDVKHPRRRLAALLEPLADFYDLAVLDCPPAISLASESVFGAADALLVPIIPTVLSARTLTQLDEFLDDRRHRPDLFPFFSMVDGRRALHRSTIESLVKSRNDILPTRIPNSSAVERMAAERAPIAAFAPSTPAAKAFRALWQDIAARLHLAD